MNTKFKKNWQRPGGFLKPLSLAGTMFISLALVLSVCGEATSTSIPANSPTPVASTATAKSGADLPTYWPTVGWRSSTPEEQGIDSQQLLTTLQHIEKDNINIRTITVVRNGYAVLEAANSPFTLDRLYPVYSITKSVVGALIGIAINEGYLKDVNQKLLSFFPERTIANRTPDKEAITIEDLLTMRSGLDCSDDKLNGAVEASKDWVQYILDLPMASPPGQNLVYCSAGVHLLSAILTKVTGIPTSDYAQSRLFTPLGVAATDLTWDKDPQGITIGGYGISIRPRDMAKFGLLYLYGGKWEDKQVVPENWVTTSTAIHSIGSNKKDYGYLFWVYPTHFAAEGYAQQMIQVVKNSQMVVVLTSAIKNDDWPIILNLLQEYLIPAAKSASPLPPNPAVLQSLQEKVRYMANPVQAVQPLPEIAKTISGTTFGFQDNQAGWKNLTLNFEEGKPQAEAVVVAQNGTSQTTDTVWIGLDNVYRVEHQQGGNFVARRAYWADDHTLLVRQLQSSPPLEEGEIRVIFSGEKIMVHVEEKVFGNYNFDLEGQLSQG
ncbi:MAG: serine hydrolase [Chloroflexi bacterium]|nr:serine hydrolase [Chloroflexota bacterium]OJW01847.1 MAG: hypothetical protein BGO39_28255 [Chloroflexi bacterium 54-19]